MKVKQFIDTFYEEATKYQALYKLSDEWVWYSMGMAYHAPSVSTGNIPELLDESRKSFSTIQERVTNPAD